MSNSTLFVHPCISIAIGSGGSGKTTFIRWFARNKIEEIGFEWVKVICATKYDEEYDWIDPDHVISGNPDKQLEELVKFIESEKGKKKGLLVFDDITALIDWKLPIYTKIATEYRHLNISVLIGIHYANKCPPVLREASSHVIIFQQQAKRSIEAIYESWGQVFETYNVFKQWLAKNTKKYQFVLYTKVLKDDMPVAQYQPGRVEYPVPDFYIHQGPEVPVFEVEEEPEKTGKKEVVLTRKHEEAFSDDSSSDSYIASDDEEEERPPSVKKGKVSVKH